MIYIPIMFCPWTVYSPQGVVIGMVRNAKYRAIGQFVLIPHGVVLGMTKDVDDRVVMGLIFANRYFLHIAEILRVNIWLEIV